MERPTHRKLPPNLEIFTLSFAHFAAGLLSFLVAITAAIWLVPSLTTLGTFRAPMGWLLAHLLLLGFASMIAIGASYQIMQVIMRTNLFSKTLGWMEFVLYVTGLLLIIYGFAYTTKLIAAGGALLTVSVLIYAVNIVITLILKREWNPFVLGIVLAVCSFIGTVALGLMIGMRMAYNTGSLSYDNLFHSHLWLGIGGWLSGLIIVFSYKLLPMFYVSGKKVSAIAYWTIGGFHLGIALKVVAIWLNHLALSIASIVALTAALVGFVIFGFQVRKESRAKQPVGAVRVALYLIPITGILFATWYGSDLLGFSTPIVAEAMIATIVIGWFAPSILAYLSKILPFLWWAYRFRTKEQKKGAVLLVDMLPEGRLSGWLVVYVISAYILSLGFLLGIPWITLIGCLTLSASAIIYLVELSRVFKY